MKNIWALLVCISLTTTAFGAESPKRQKSASFRKSPAKQHKPPLAKTAPRALQKDAESEGKKQARLAGYRDYQMRLQAEERGRSEYLRSRKN
jgi:hypothetical protein